LWGGQVSLGDAVTAEVLHQTVQAAGVPAGQWLKLCSCVSLEAYMPSRLLVAGLRYTRCWLQASL
jgi:hypothetical protein